MTVPIDDGDTHYGRHRHGKNVGDNGSGFVGDLRRWENLKDLDLQALHYLVRDWRWLSTSKLVIYA